MLVNEDLSMKTLSISRVRLIRSADMMTSSIAAAGLGDNRPYLKTSKSSSLVAVSLFMLVSVWGPSGSPCASTLEEF